MQRSGWTKFGLLFLAAAALVGWSLAARAEGEDEISAVRVMSFNIRLLTWETDMRDLWWKRRDPVADLIKRRDPDVIGMQEVYKLQARDLAARLPEYQWYGVPREDGATRGEMCAIFYRAERLTLLDSGTFWLSLTPEKPGSRSWGTACVRIVSWAKFQDRKTGKEFFLFNTHFDHISKIARRESAKLLVKTIPEIAGASPVIITGDFNAAPDTEPIQTMTAAYTDARSASATPARGPEKTSRDFRPGAEPKNRIDYIFASKGIAVKTFATIDDEYGRGRRPSDHMPVRAALEIP